MQGVYVILGIGVDDVYVFLAAFEQCEVGSSSLEQQLVSERSRLTHTPSILAVHP